MEDIQSFTQSHWMPLLVKCLRHIAPVTAMVIAFEWNIQNTTETQLLASNYGTNQSLVVYEKFIPCNEFSTQLIDATSFIEIRNAMIGAEELANISSYQMLSADKK